MKKTILVVDDELSMTHLLNIVLLKKGYNVITVNDPRLVAGILQDTTPDLIILDYMMPEIDGIQLCRMLRERDSTRRTPIFILSALNDPRVVQESVRAGVDAYFTKDQLATGLLQEVQRRVAV